MTRDVAPARWFRVTVQSLRTATTVAALTVVVALGAVGPVTQPPATSSGLGMSSGPLDDMMQRNRCSFTGFDKSVIPSKAIVRDLTGETELVSFEQGWAVFSGEAAGELVAVCLGPEVVPAPTPSPVPASG